MKAIPVELLQILGQLPDDKPCQITLHYNGQSKWRVEFMRSVSTPCTPQDSVSLAQIIDTIATVGYRIRP